MIKSFKDLQKAIDEKEKPHKPVKMAILNPASPHIISAVRKAVEDKLIDPITIGPMETLKPIFAENEIDISKIYHINADSLEESISAIINLKPACILKGDVSSRKLAETLSDSSNGLLPKSAVLSHIGLVKVEKYNRLMLLTDGVVHGAPNVAMKIKIIQNAAALSNRLGNDKPKASMLAAVEAIYPAIPVTMEEAAIAKMSDRGQIKGVEIDGPLSFDCTISQKVAEAKGIMNSKVAGRADIFAMPSIETANGTYKALVMFTGAEGAGILYGGTIPIACPYAIDTEQNVFNSIMLAAYLAWS